MSDEQQSQQPSQPIDQQPVDLNERLTKIEASIQELHQKIDQQGTHTPISDEGLQAKLARYGIK